MNESLLPAKYDALQRQLERMRAMQSAYFTRFFSWIIGTALLFLLLWLIPFPQSQMLLPFLVLTAGVQASFYLHFVDFARMHARALERRINQLLGEKLLVGAELEDAYFYPIAAPKLSGFIFARPSAFFSAYTLHWCGLWGFLFVAGLFRVWPVLGRYQFFYLVLLGTWTMLNTSYLAWFFGRRRDLRKVDAILRKTYPDGS